MLGIVMGDASLAAVLALGDGRSKSRASKSSARG